MPGYMSEAVEGIWKCTSLPCGTPALVWYAGTSTQVVRGDTTKLPVLSSGGATSTATASGGGDTHISGAAPVAHRLATARTQKGAPRNADWFMAPILLQVQPFRFPPSTGRAGPAP